MHKIAFTGIAAAALMTLPAWAQDQPLGWPDAHFQQRIEAARKPAPMKPVVALVDIYQSQQQAVFESRESGCRYFGMVEFDDKTHTWVVSINTKLCGTEAHKISALVRGTSEGVLLLHAGDGAILEPN